MDNRERLAIATALQKGLKSATDAARDAIAADMEPGERKVLAIDGTEVGTATLARPTTGWDVVVVSPTDLMQWCIDNQMIPDVKVPAAWYGHRGWLTVKGCEFVTDEGEVLPGVVAVPKEGEPVLKVLGCKPEETLPLLSADMVQEALSMVAAPMLEAGA